MTKRYLIDANIFIDAHNLYYHPNFCQLFWSWLEAGHKADLFYSIDIVKDEIAKSTLKNELADYIRKSDFVLSGFFIRSSNSSELIQSYKDVIQWATTNSHYTDSAKEDFADINKADAALIAVAKLHGYSIVTSEVSQPQEKKRIRIPDVAKIFGVEVIRLDKLLKIYAENNFNLIV